MNLLELATELQPADREKHRVIVLRLPEDDEELVWLAITDSEYASGPIDVMVEMLAPDRVRVAEPCFQLFPRVVFGDVILVRELEDGSFVWRDLLARPRMTRLVFSGGFPSNFLDRPSVRRMFDRVVSTGGNWELTFGNRLEVFLPEDSDFLPEFNLWFDRLIDRERAWSQWSEAEGWDQDSNPGPGHSTVQWLYDEQLQVDEEWSLRWCDGFFWWADEHAQAIEVGDGVAPDGALGDLVQVRTEVVRDVDLTDEILRALQSDFMAYSSLSGPVYDPVRRSLSLCSLVRVHEDMRHWLSPILSMAAMLQVSEAQTLGRKLSERFDVEAAVEGHPERGKRPAPDELARGVPARLIREGQEECRWTTREFRSTLDRVRSMAPAYSDPQFVSDAIVEEDYLIAGFPFAEAVSTFRLHRSRPHPKYGNGLHHIQSFPLPELTAADGARLALSLNRRYLIDDVAGYGLGSFCYFNDMVHLTSFFPNAMYGISLVQNLCFAALHRSEVLREHLLQSSRDA